MEKKIVLTSCYSEQNSVPMIFNPNSIDVMFEREEGGSVIWISGQNYEVKESLEEIDKIIEEARLSRYYYRIDLKVSHCFQYIPVESVIRFLVAKDTNYITLELSDRRNISTSMTDVELRKSIALLPM